MSFYYKKMSNNKLVVSRIAADIKLDEEIQEEYSKYTSRKLAGAHFLTQKDFILSNSFRWEIKVKGKMPKKSELEKVQLKAVNGFAYLGIFEAFIRKYGGDDALLVTLVFDELFDPNIEAMNYNADMEIGRNMIENRPDKKEPFSKVISYYLNNTGKPTSIKSAAGHNFANATLPPSIGVMDDFWERSNSKKLPAAVKPKVKRTRDKAKQKAFPDFESIFLKKAKVTKFA